VVNIGSASTSPATIAAHGGKYLIRNGAKELREGALPADRLVVLEFPSVAQARTWYESPEYQALAPIRQGASKGSLVIVEGFGEVP
jgi:uncharacterized protein (DUF1330 family)